MPCSSCGCSKLIVLIRDYCSSDIKDDEARKVAQAVICPAEMNNDEEVTVELS
jgi:hypothetical protein